MNLDTVLQNVKQKKRKVKPPDVSDHALVRYFERVLGFDMQIIKQDILSDAFLSIWKILEPARARIPFCEGFSVVVQDQIIVTIVGRRDKRKGLKR